MISILNRLWNSVRRQAGQAVANDRLRRRFWDRFALGELNKQEWEALCDGCGLCCLLKFEEDGSDEVRMTNVACRLLDLEHCRCRHYQARTKIVPDCIVLSPETVGEIISWMPSTCAYRLRHEGRSLFPWHYLNSGSRETVHEAGISARGRTISETEIDMDELEDYAVRRDS